jgi:hypothetical protein
MIDLQDICGSKINCESTVLENVIQLAVEIAREGREGHKVGTLFVVSDEKEVLIRSRPLILDPLLGHPAEKKKICDPDMRETIKELAQLDGAFIVSGCGVCKRTWSGPFPFPWPSARVRLLLRCKPAEAVHHPGHLHHGVSHDGDPERENHLQGSRYKLQLTTQVINFVLGTPIGLLYRQNIFRRGPEKYGLWAVGLFLIGVLPTSGMTISWTGFAKGNKEAAIKMVVFGLVLGALAAPVYTKVFMGATIDVNMLHMFKQIALFVFVPLCWWGC